MLASRAADRFYTLDKPSSLKLAWLSKAMYLRGDDVDPGLKNELIDNGLGWFPFFVRRWMRAAVNVYFS